MGLKQAEITEILSNCHGIQLSIRQLKRILNRLHLYRRLMYSDVRDVVDFIHDQISGSGNRLGYRLMHLRCLQAGYIVQKETVRYLLAILDPHGVEMRRRVRLHRRVYSSDGPNSVWHVDGYDKLKPFGLCVSGCIDGFSRHIIWLRVSYTNNDPAVIASFYIGAVRTLGGIPVRVRTDMGTENTFIAEMQTFLGGSYIYGTSQHNQRIECWWSTLRRSNVQYWLTIFHQLKNDNHFSGDLLDKSLVQFCFTTLLQVCFMCNTLDTFYS